MSRISTRFLVTLGALACVFSALVLAQTWHSNRAQIEKLISSKAELAQDFDLAIREYVGQTIRPTVGRLVPREEYIPEVMSTSFVAKSVFDKVREKHPDYLLRFASDQPRNPETGS